MTRKDTILVAVVINAGLLAILFAAAIIYDEEILLEEQPTKAIQELVAVAPTPSPSHTRPFAAQADTDEVDNLLTSYQSVDSEFKNDNVPTTALQPLSEAQKNPPKEEDNESDERIVIVAKGDTLEKIAKANQTTIATLKKANQLQSEKLSIGQQLKVPPKSIAKSEKTQEKEQEVRGDDEVKYHIVKSGDSPWKIAKLYGVKYDDILRLNNLDENKARNLKVGDRVRVK